MPFTTTPLADDDLDALLGGAAARLGGVAAGLSVGPAPAPASSAGPRLAAVAAVGLAVAGVAGVLAVSRGGEGAAPLPPGFAEGRYGTEIPIAEVDDGDGNPDTILLRISPATEVGSVTIRRNAAAAGSTATTAAGSVGASVPVTSPLAQLCVDSPGAGGMCADAAFFAQPQLTVGQRGPNGTALVTGVPADVVAVVFTAGTERHWQRPLQGVALFPLDAAASPDAVATLVRSDGSEAGRAVGRDGSVTDAEIASQAATKPTGVDLPAVWVGRPTAALSASSGGWLRRFGRPTATSFGGPFAIQGFTADGAGADGPGVFLVTVRTDQAEEARARLALTTSGAVRRSVDHPDGTTVLAWARPATTDDQIAELLGTLSAREPELGEMLDLSQPWAWHGQRTGPYVSTEVDATMFGLPVGLATFDGRDRRVWATGDDLGSIRFASLTAVADASSLAGAIVEPNQPWSLPAAPQPLSAGTLWPVPATTTSLRITFDDGTVLDAPLLDVRPLVDAKLAVFTHGGTVRSVDAR